VFRNKVSDRVKQRERSKTYKFWITRDESSSTIVSSVEGKRTERFSEKSSRYREILSNLRFGSLEIRDTSVTRVTNKF
jgi:hypothetical protein